MQHIELIIFGLLVAIAGLGVLAAVRLPPSALRGTARRRRRRRLRGALARLPQAAAGAGRRRAPSPARAAQPGGDQRRGPPPRGARPRPRGVPDRRIVAAAYVTTSGARRLLRPAGSRSPARSAAASARTCGGRTG